MVKTCSIPGPIQWYKLNTAAAASDFKLANRKVSANKSPSAMRTATVIIIALLVAFSTISNLVKGEDTNILFLRIILYKNNHKVINVAI